MGLFDKLGYVMSEVGYKLEKAVTSVDMFVETGVNNTIGNGMEFVGKKAHLIDNDRKKKDDKVTVNKEAKKDDKKVVAKDIEGNIYAIIADEIKCWSNINAANKDKVVQSIECKLATEYNKPITEDIRKQLVQAIDFAILLK